MVKIELLDVKFTAIIYPETMSRGGGYDAEVKAEYRDLIEKAMRKFFEDNRVIAMDDSRVMVEFREENRDRLMGRMTAKLKEAYKVAEELDKHSGWDASFVRNLEELKHAVEISERKRGVVSGLKYRNEED